MWRIPLVAALLGLMAGAGAPPPSPVVRAWFPVAVGNRWVYQHAAFDAGEHGMADPKIERWKTEETIDAVTDVADGTMIVEHVRAYDHEMLIGWLAENDATTRLRPVERILIHENCLYRDGDTYRGADGEDTPSLCFPMAAGGTWGQSAATSPALEAVWHVRAVAGDPFGVAGARTYHASAHEGAGFFRDIWYTQGIGIVQDVGEHHGTYLEERSQLLSTTLAGEMRAYSLQPARTVPVSELDCLGIGWQHFAHEDGSAFVTPTDCVEAARRTPRR
jgi:hypothetical protein